MAISTHGLEAIRLSAEPIGGLGDAYIKTSSVDASGNPITVGNPVIQSGTNGAISVTSTPIALNVSGSNLTSRSLLTAVPIDGKIWWGFSNSVSSSNGIPLEQGEQGVWKISASANVWVVSAGTVDVRVAEGVES